jgi:prepilin-type N-terminal cleavage/methylation domain-containing protein
MNKTKPTQRAFTLVEMVVTLAIVGVMATMGGVIWSHSRARARAIQCASNQREISTALLSYYTDHGSFPSDDPRMDIAVQLMNYVGYPIHQHNNTLPDVYRCPNDRGDKRSNSYQPYYVRRRSPQSANYFVLGCPRHEDAESGYLNTFGLNSAASGKPGQIRLNGQRISPEQSVEDRSIQNGEMTFSDGSSVKITESEEGYHISAVASFRHEDGRLYTVVRISGKGKADFKVTPGSRFEVVTPVSIIGVRGTVFDVETDEQYAHVELHEGKIEVWDRLSNKAAILTPGQTITIGTQDTDWSRLCIACKSHCKSDKKNQKHCWRCPLHVDKPNLIGTHDCVECSKHCRTYQWHGRTIDIHCPMFCTNGLLISRVPSPAD